MSQTLVECHHCGGRGKIRLSPRLEAALLLVPKKCYASTLNMLNSVPDLKNAALCNRLSKLETLGLVASRWQGRNKLWIRK